MGGIAIVGAVVVGYLFAHVRRKSVAFSTSGWTLLALIVGLGHRRLPRRLPRRARPPEPRAAQARQDVRHRRDRGRVRVARARLRAHVDAPVVHAAARASTSARSAGSCWAILIVYATANAVNLTDGLDGLAAGSSAFVFARVHDHRVHRVPAPDDLRRAPREPGARPGDRRGRDVRRVRGVPVVERGARARSSWATPARSRSAARWPASRCSRARRLLLPILAGLAVSRRSR